MAKVSNFESKMRDMQMGSETSVPLNSYTVLQLDGKAFHTFTRGMDKPFDKRFMDAMDSVLLELCRQVGNVKFGFVQSDEISLLLTDFDTPETSMVFNGRVQKIVSTAAGLASAVMTRLYPEKKAYAVFDARVFHVSSKMEVLEWFHWRQTDCVKNSVSSAGQAVFTSKELHGKNSMEVKNMLSEAGEPWTRLPEGFKFGRVALRETYLDFRMSRSRSSCIVDMIEVEKVKWSVADADGMFVDTVLPSVGVKLEDYLI